MSGQQGNAAAFSFLAYAIIHWRAEQKYIDICISCYNYIKLWHGLRLLFSNMDDDKSGLVRK